MRKQLFLVAALGLLSCTREGEFRASVFELGTAFTAKNFCSCLFVTGQKEDFCREYVALDQVSPRLTVDYEKKSVESSFLFFVRRSARFAGDDVGCWLD